MLFVGSLFLVCGFRLTRGCNYNPIILSIINDVINEKFTFPLGELVGRIWNNFHGDEISDHF